MISSENKANSDVHAIKCGMVESTNCSEIQKRIDVKC